MADPNQKRKNRSWLSDNAGLIGGAAASSLPLASLAQDVFVDIPRIRDTVNAAPEMSFHDLEQKVQPGDVGLEFYETSPLLSRQTVTGGGGLVSGSSVGHGALLRNSQQHGQYANPSPQTVEGGYGNFVGYKDWLAKQPKWQHLNEKQTAESGTGLLDRAIASLRGLVDQRHGGLLGEWKWLSDRASSLQEYQQKVDSGELPASNPFDFASMSVPKRVLRDSPDVVDWTKTPVMVMRSPTAARLNANPNTAADFRKLVDSTADNHATNPYSPVSALTAGIKHLLLPHGLRSVGTESTVPEYTPGPHSSEHCMAPAGDFLSRLKDTFGRKPSDLLPSDIAAHPGMAPVGIALPSDGTKKITKDDVQNLISDARSRRIAAGLIAASLVGLGGYGITKLVQNLWPKRKKEENSKVKVAQTIVTQGPPDWTNGTVQEAADMLVKCAEEQFEKQAVGWAAPLVAGLGGAGIGGLLGAYNEYRKDDKDRDYLSGVLKGMATGGVGGAGAGLMYDAYKSMPQEGQRLATVSTGPEATARAKALAEAKSTLDKANEAYRGGTTNTSPVGAALWEGVKAPFKQLLAPDHSDMQAAPGTLNELRHDAYSLLSGNNPVRLGTEGYGLLSGITAASRNNRNTAGHLATGLDKAKLLGDKLLPQSATTGPASSTKWYNPLTWGSAKDKNNADMAQLVKEFPEATQMLRERPDLLRRVADELDRGKRNWRIPFSVQSFLGQKPDPTAGPTDSPTRFGWRSPIKSNIERQPLKNPTTQKWQFPLRFKDDKYVGGKDAKRPNMEQPSSVVAGELPGYAKQKYDKAIAEQQVAEKALGPQQQEIKLDNEAAKKQWEAEALAAKKQGLKPPKPPQAREVPHAPAPSYPAEGASPKLEKLKMVAENARRGARGKRVGMVGLGLLPTILHQLHDWSDPGAQVAQKAVADAVKTLREHRVPDEELRKQWEALNIPQQ